MSATPPSSTLAEVAALLNSLSGVLTSLGVLLVAIARLMRSKKSESRSSEADSPPSLLASSDSEKPTPPSPDKLPAKDE